MASKLAFKNLLRSLVISNGAREEVGWLGEDHRELWSSMPMFILSHVEKNVAFYPYPKNEDIEGDMTFIIDKFPKIMGWEFV